MQLQGNVERTAALSLFHHDVRRVVLALTTRSGSEDDPSLIASRVAVALAISGANPTDLLWREACTVQATTLRSPYLRASLGFLTGDDRRTFAAVLGERDLSLADRVGFALRFLGDEPLNALLQTLVQECIETGNLYGILLTGVDRDVRLACCWPCPLLFSMVMAPFAPAKSNPPGEGQIKVTFTITVGDSLQAPHTVIVTVNMTLTRTSKAVLNHR